MSSSPTASARFTVHRADPHDWAFVARWCESEGWNPGRSDGPGFLPQDPEGFFVGRLDGEIASSVSVVNYDDVFSFLGFYIVRPDLRGRGYGLATWQEAVKHAGQRTIGLDGVLAQEGNYERSGFSTVYRTVRYNTVRYDTARHDTVRPGGAPPGSASPDSESVPAAVVVPAAEVPVEAVAQFDRQCFPADRPDFVARWLSLPGHTAYVHTTGDRVTGYGVIRPSHDGYRVGPLFAADHTAAEELFDALAATAGTESVFIDVPEPNEAARKLLEARGLVPGFETVRMYTGPTRPIAVGYVYGVTTLELG